MADAARAEERKAAGNDFFSRGKLEAAIEAYSEAICFAPSEPIYYTNRAMCNRKKMVWDSVISDCEQALRLDGTSIKGHYLLGVALDAQAAHGAATRHLFRALELCKERTISYKEDIQRAMLGARRREWEAASAASDLQVQQTEGMVRRLLREHYDSERRRLGGCGGESLQSLELSGEERSVVSCVDEAMGALRSQRGPTAVPDYLCCKITMEIMLDPVTTPNGITYERSALLEHLNKVGKFDPVTREALQSSQLVSNLGLKEAINAYLERHPWAYEASL
jgi:STIP1 family protein 1